MGILILACTTATTGAIVNSIQRIIRMTFRAVSHARLLRYLTDATQYILTRCHCFNMGRINTSGISTQVVRNKLHGHLPVNHFIRKAVCGIQPPLYNKSPIAISLASCPYPTLSTIPIWPVFLYFSPEPLFYGLARSRSTVYCTSMSQAGIMGTTQSQTLMRSFASIHVTSIISLPHGGIEWCSTRPSLPVEFTPSTGQMNATAFRYGAYSSHREHMLPYTLSRDKEAI